MMLAPRTALSASSVASSSTVTLDDLREEEALTRSTPRTSSRASPASTPGRSPRATGTGSRGGGFPCFEPGCGKVFKARAKLDAHLTSHSDERPFTCSYTDCDAAFKRKEHLLTHEQRVHSTTAPASPASAASDGAADGRKFVCDHTIGQGDAQEPCGKRFWTNAHLQRHIAQVHADPDTLEAASGAQGAGLAGSAAAGPEAEAEQEKKAYACTEPGCAASFHKRKRLREHVWAAHSLVPDRYASPSARAAPAAADPSAAVAKPFPCSYPGCDKAFPTMVKRRQHAKVHEQGRYTCSLPHAAGASGGGEASADADAQDGGVLEFSTWSALQKHMKDAHPPECPYPECASKTFKTKENLREHIRRHREREVAAANANTPAAGLSGASASGAQADEDERQRAADEGRVYACTSAGCKKTFKTRYALSSHFNIHHLGIKRFVCGGLNDASVAAAASGSAADAAPQRGCGWKFGHKHELVRHLRTCPARQGAHGTSKGKGKAADAAGASDESEDAEMSGLENDSASMDDKDQPGAAPTEAADSDAEVEHDDEYFRAEGGAVPQKDAERPPAPVRASLKRKRAADALDPVGSSSVGAGESAALASPGHSRKAARKRKMRGAVLGCPWARIVAIRREAGSNSSDEHADAPEAELNGSAATEQDAADEDAPPSAADLRTKCTERFGRLYDLARHLDAAHGIALSNAQIRALLPPEQAAALAKPRKGAVRERQAAAAGSDARKEM